MRKKLSNLDRIISNYSGSVAASLKVWFGRFRRVRGFFVKIIDWGELVVSEVVVEEGEEVGEVRVEVDEDLAKSKLNPWVLPQLELIYWFKS